MAKELVDTITNDEIREWYNENTAPNFLDNVAVSIQGGGYSFDPKSGLFIKPLFEKIVDKLNQTIVQVVFPRPTDIHYHEDIDESIMVLRGRGKMGRDLNQSKYKWLNVGQEAFIPKGDHHYFCPDEETILELMIVCSGILNPSKEKCVRPFQDIDWYQKLKF